MLKDSRSNLKIDPQSRRVSVSVVDRLLLIDDDRQRQLDEYDADALRRDVRRNLETLLNTRRPAAELPSHLTCLVDSVYQYGIPDFTEIGFGGIEQFRVVCQQVEEAISRFEPRLLGVRVEFQEHDVHHLDRVLRFRITAKLQARPRPQVVVYDSVVDPTTYDFEVRAT